MTKFNGYLGKMNIMSKTVVVTVYVTSPEDAVKCTLENCKELREVVNLPLFFYFFVIVAFSLAVYY